VQGIGCNARGAWIGAIAHYLLPAPAGSSISACRCLLLKASDWMTTIYVGNLSFNATEQDVRSLFERHGKVDSVKLIMDRETGKPRGFGFVDMDQNEAQAAIQALNGHQMNGRPLRVNEAQERPQRPRQGGGPFRR
jgi:RNA recognition motif-containing protein